MGGGPNGLGPGLKTGVISEYEVTGKQILIYLQSVPVGEPVAFSYHLTAQHPLADDLVDDGHGHADVTKAADGQIVAVLDELLDRALAIRQLVERTR